MATDSGLSGSSSAPPVDDDLVLHVRHGPEGSQRPVPLNALEPTEFELGNFQGRCMFLHRPAGSYDNSATEASYPYKPHFHGRKRLWEWRLQGRFKRRPRQLYCGIELEEYVPVNFATRTLMRGILPLVQGALQCKLVHHEVGRPDDPSLRPTVVAPVWAADNTLVHEDPGEAPELTVPTLPTGLNRKAARQFWEEVWAGGGPSWDDGGPCFTIAVWGPSPLLDLRAWAFRGLPLMWKSEISMEPFCGKQPVHVVVYELDGREGPEEHRQGRKAYAIDVRMAPKALWLERSAREAGRSRPRLPELDLSQVARQSEDEERGPLLPPLCRSPSEPSRQASGDTTFRSAKSHSSSRSSIPDLEGEGSASPAHSSGSPPCLLGVSLAGDSEDVLRSPGGALPQPLVPSVVVRPKPGFWAFCRCMRRNRSHGHNPWDLLPV